MGEERRPLSGHQGFVEPRQLTLDYHNREDTQPYPRETRLRHESDPDAVGSQDPLARPYVDLEHARYLSPGSLPDTLDLNVRGGSRSPFLWTGDYGPSIMDEFPPLRLDHWGPRVDERPNLGYDEPSLPPLGFPASFPGVSEMLGHPPGLALPPLHSFAPLSPFPYETSSMELFQPHPRSLNIGQPELGEGSHLPLLPSLGNYFEDQRFLQEPPPPPPLEASSKKTRIDKRNTKPLTVEDLLHDNSRFAKVVKAFLSIEDQENRTVPEIAKRVSEMYAGQYADFEGVKRMVNDVLQKHKAFWHPGRGSPYQLNLNEGRARREFPSNSRRLVRNRYDGDLFYSRSKKQKKAKPPVRKARDPVVSDSLDSSLFQRNSPCEDEGNPNPSEIETFKSVELGVIDPSLLDLDGSRCKDMLGSDEPFSPGKLRQVELNTVAQPGT